MVRCVMTDRDLGAVCQGAPGKPHLCEGVLLGEAHLCEGILVFGAVSGRVERFGPGEERRWKPSHRVLPGDPAEQEGRLGSLQRPGLPQSPSSFEVWTVGFGDFAPE